MATTGEFPDLPMELTLAGCVAELQRVHGAAEVADLLPCPDPHAGAEQPPHHHHVVVVARPVPAGPGAYRTRWRFIRRLVGDAPFRIWATGGVASDPRLEHSATDIRRAFAERAPTECLILRHYQKDRDAWHCAADYVYNGGGRDVELYFDSPDVRIEADNFLWRWLGHCTLRYQ